MKVLCVCVCVCVCRCVCVGVYLCSCKLVKRVHRMGMAFCKKVPNFQMDSQICTGFSKSLGHEPKDSKLTVWANWQKGGVAVGVACNKKADNL